LLLQTNRTFLSDEIVEKLENFKNKERERERERERGREGDEVLNV